ncbi:selT/selW/selH-like putative selenoprotein [Sinorhizobium meliloti]
MSEKPRVTILYCTQCNWLLRAGWMAQELLSTFADTLGEVALIPGTGGNFEIRVDGALIWERKRDGGFPGPKELKQRIRDVIEPERDLGHTTRTGARVPPKAQLTRSAQDSPSILRNPARPSPWAGKTLPRRRRGAAGSL